MKDGIVSAYIKLPDGSTETVLGEIKAGLFHFKDVKARRVEILSYSYVEDGLAVGGMIHDEPKEVETSIEPLPLK